MSTDFVVVSPQAPAAAGASWSDSEGVAIDALEDLAAAITEALAVDVDRVYLTGLSMGGAGTWRWASTHPEHFAAIAPICGGLGESNSEALKTMPIWLFVGADDGGAKRCDETADTMRSLGAPIKYTVYPDAPAPFQPTDSSPERGPQAGHDSWSAAYADPSLYEWLLSHTLAASEEPAAEDPAEGDSGNGGILGWVRGLFAKL